jgi:predicted secreted protein
MKKHVKVIMSATLLLWGAASLWAGDVAVFRNLGFSPDSRYFQFAQYGIDGTTQTPWVQVDTVDVPRNLFTPSGMSKVEYSVPATLGDDGLKALMAHLDSISVQRKGLKLDFLQQGRPIYFRVTGEATGTDYDNFSVLDYKTGRTTAVSLKKTINTKGTIKSSSFFINLEIKDKTGKAVGTYKVGHPDVVRKGVQNYTVVQIILTPNERALVFVIEREESDGKGGINLRNMVETLTF